MHFCIPWFDAKSKKFKYLFMFPLQVSLKGGSSLKLNEIYKLSSAQTRAQEVLGLSRAYSGRIFMEFNVYSVCSL